MPAASTPVPVRPRKVALLIETSNAYARGLLEGIVAYQREHRPWSLHLAEHGRGDKPPAWLADWDGDGIIARIENAAIARALRPLRLPIVDMSAARLVPALPWFETDDAAIAQMGYEHLRERGFRNFAFCGDSRFNWSNWRQEHFERAVRAEGGTCFTYAPSPAPAAKSEANETIARWLHQLPKPVAVMACYDLLGVQVLDACRRLAIPVPDEVAVIAVDNDALLCELASPPLSSVIPNTRRTGYEAAALLDTLMAGGQARGETHLIPPLGVATRQSTDVLAIEDQHVSRAVRFIREHACYGINVQDVLRAVPQARRLLEARFRKLLGRTPHAEILRVQLQRVKQLLTETDLTIEVIAERTGFAHSEYLSVVFRREVGLPPGRYREQHR